MAKTDTKPTSIRLVREADANQIIIQINAKCDVCHKELIHGAGFLIWLGSEKAALRE